MKSDNDTPDVDEVERCRAVRRQIESENAGFEGYFVWAKEIDQQWRQATRATHKATQSSKRGSRRSALHRGKRVAARKSSKTGGKS